MKNILYILTFAAIMSSCERIVDIDLPTYAPKLVIDCQINNVLEPWKVELSYTQPYLQQTDRKTITEAEVFIFNSDNDTVRLSHTDTGVYVSAAAHQTIPGKTYTLVVKNGNQTYTATEKAPEGFPIDLMQAFFLPNNNGFIQSGFYVFLKGEQVRKKGEANYIWKFYQNDTLKESNFTLAENDEFGNVSFLNPEIDPNDPLKGLADNILPRPFPFLVEPGDSIKIEQFNVSPTYYQYVIDLDIQKGRSGSPFDPPPANPFSNLSNGALGFFSVAYKVEREILVEK